MEREPLLFESEILDTLPKPQTPKIKPSHFRLVDAGMQIADEPPSNQDKAFTTRYLVQATLPYRNPKGNPPHWTRYNGNYSLSIEPGHARIPGTHDRRCIGYPYGSIPRLNQTTEDWHRRSLFGATTLQVSLCSGRQLKAIKVTKFVTRLFSISSCEFTGCHRSVRMSCGLI